MEKSAMAKGRAKARAAKDNHKCDILVQGPLSDGTWTVTHKITGTVYYLPSRLDALEVKATLVAKG